MTQDGYILTNNHVVEGADKVTVRLLNRSEFTAKVIGTDPKTDVAVLKIDATGLTPASLGDSDRERVGEWVLAVGNPLGDGLTFTVTSGIISAKGRTLNGLQPHHCQHLRLHPDRCGDQPGQLGRAAGQRAGRGHRHQQRRSRARPATTRGYGFAIPINLARQVMTQLISTGKVQRAALGIQIAGGVTPNDAKYVGLNEPYGVKVADFPPNSPAEKAGIEVGDIIVVDRRQEGGARGPAAAGSRLQGAGRSGQRRGRPQGRRPQDLQGQAAVAERCPGPGERACRRQRR